MLLSAFLASLSGGSLLSVSGGSLLSLSGGSLLSLLMLCLLQAVGEAQDRGLGLGLGRIKRNYTGSASYDPRFGPLLTVSSILIEPYVMIDFGRRNATNGGYKGYVVDLMDKVSEIVGFKYRIMPVSDGTYGYRRSDGTWNGMIGALVNKEADMAAAPMYITKHRAEAVDFTHSFLTVEATILLRRPRPGHETHIKSAYDLINQSEYIFGTLNTGVIIRALRTSNETLPKLLWQKMRSFHPSVFTKTNEDGINRVRRDRFAYILPTVIGDYIKARMPCDLITVDHFLMERGYGMAVQKGSGLLPKLNRALELLHSGGYLDEIYQKWWVKTGECNGIKSSKMYSLDGATALRLSHSHLTWISLLSTTLLYTNT